MRLQGIVQQVQGYPECRVPDRPAVSFHRGRHLYNELGAFRLFRRVADARRHELYFTSNKSSIIELCDWMGRNNTIGNLFTGSEKVEFNARMNYNSSYTDIMLFKNADGTEYKEAA